MRSACYWCLLLLAWWPMLCCPSVDAHPISLSSTIADVKRDRIEVEIEIMLEDLVLYHRVAADGDMRYAEEELKAAADKHRQFLLDYFTILDGQGQRLVGSIQSVDMTGIDAGGVGQTELMRRSLRYRIDYPLPSQPVFLTFMQNFGGEKAILPAVMDLHVLLNGAFGEKSAQITFGRPHTVKLDWEAHQPGQKITMADVRRLRQEQVRERLGIASYTGLFSFLYITRFEVRHEVLIPLLTLEQWLPIARRDKDFLDVDEQAAARSRIEAFFQEKSFVSINGSQVKARLSRLNFFGLDINDFALNADPRRVNVAQARVGVILSFPSAEVPREVAVRWTTYSEHAPYIHSIVLVGNEPPTQHDFQSLDDTFAWSGDLLPVEVRPVAVQAALHDDVTRREVMTALLTNIYRAFDFRDDEDVYDALASSAGGRLLRDLYLRIKRSLLLAEQGGALAHVTAVEVTSVTPMDGSNSNTLECVWQVTGVAEHWGHVHTRTSQYRARIALGESEGNWQVLSFQLIDEKRLKFETSIRG